MSFFAQVGVSSGDDGYAVAVNACQGAITKLGKEPECVIVFASVKYDQGKVLQGVRSVAKKALIVGSSTSGEITTEGPAKTHSVAVMAISSDTVTFYAGVGEHIKEGPRDAGRRVAKSVKEQALGGLKAFLMFPDVLVGNGSDIVRGVLDEMGEHFPVIGGASGDDFQFKQTYQYVNDTVYSGAVVGLGLSGAFNIGIGVKHGWVPLGSPRRVTKSVGAVLHELDNKPAISIYEDYFGPEQTAEMRKDTLAKLAITYPLGIRSETGDEMLIRDPITVDANGSITCAAEVPMGSEVQLMIGSREEAIAAAREAAVSAVSQLHDKKPAAVIIFNCIARHKLFGEHSGTEISAIQEVVGTTTPLIGFYTYGEQAPLGGRANNIKQCDSAFHNETIVIAVISET